MGVNAQFANGLEGQARVRAESLYASVHHFGGAAQEAQSWERSAAMAREVHSLDALPVTVIAINDPNYPAFMLASWHEMQRELVAKSSDSRFVVIDGADHYGLIQKPEFARRVADEIDLLARRASTVSRASGEAQ